MFLQDLGQFAADGDLTDVVEEDRDDPTRQVHQPGDADEITKLDTDGGVDQLRHNCREQFIRPVYNLHVRNLARFFSKDSKELLCSHDC